MAIERRQIAEGAVSPSKLHASLKDGTYWFEKFNRQPRLSTANGYTAPTGAAGNVNHAFFEGGQTAWHVKGTQTLLGPLISAALGGLDISQDQTDTDGVEHLFGAHLGAVNPFAATIGTSKDLWARIKFALSTGIGGAGSECAFGFRKVEAFQAAVDNYDEAAFLNILNGVVTREVILNNAATVSVDTGYDAADGVDITLETRMQGRRVRFYINGREYEIGPQFLFDAGEVIAPFFFFFQGAVPVTCTWKELEIGYASDLDGNA